MHKLMLLILTATLTVSAAASPHGVLGMPGLHSALHLSTDINADLDQSTSSGSGTTWYIRPDGGTRYSANATNGQCDGQSDTAYPGTGTNQHCAFSDYRYLWDDQSYNNDAWVIAGGDTVIIRGGPWRVGWDSNIGAGAGWTWCLGGSNGPCTNPTVPSGTPDRHTRILGENFGGCNATNKTQIFGGYGVYVALNLSGAQYVDVECMEITRHSNCIFYGTPAYPANCSSSYPVDDYDSDGIHTDAQTHDLLLQDMWIHGHIGRGIKGPIGANVTCLRCDIAYNGGAGWDFDDGSGAASVFGSNASWNFLYSKIEWSGCNQEYPAVDPIPVASCYSQSTGGYGDGVGTPAGTGTGMSVVIDHSIFRYNTQDGLDLGHMDAGTNSLSITNSMAYGNSGGQFKWGAYFQTANFTNNIAVANCLRLSAPFPGTPANYNANLGDFCRAQDAIPFDLVQGGTLLFANNTLVTYAPTSYDVGCWSSSCSNSTLTFENNITLGYDNPTTHNMGGQTGGPGDLYFQGPIGNIVRNHNLWYGMRNIHSSACPSTEICLDPLFVNEPVFADESSLDNFNFLPSPSSPAVTAAPTLLATDVLGTARPTPLAAVGALEPNSSSVILSMLDPLTGAIGTAPTTVTTTPVTPPPTTPATPVTPPPTTPVTPPPTAPAALWVKVSNEDANTKLNLPAGTTYRFGFDPAQCPQGKTCGWYGPVTVKRQSTVIPYYTSFPYDPASGVLKEIDILVTSAQQKVVISMNGSSMPLTIPAYSSQLAAYLASQNRGR